VRGLLTKSLDLRGYYYLGNLAYRYNGGKRHYHLSNCALFIIQVGFLLRSCSMFLFDDCSSSDLFTFPCIYSDVTYKGDYPFGHNLAQLGDSLVTPPD
jgi:hypothetical protein